MKLRSSPCAFAALLLWANVSQACVPAGEPVSSNFTNEEPSAPIAAEITTPTPAPDAKKAEFALPNWTLFLDHEGDTFTTLTASQIGASEHPSDEHAATEPFGPLPSALADVPVRRFLVDDEDVAAFSLTPEERAYSESKGSDQTGSTLSSAAEAEFAFPNWMVLLDHEGESFTSVSASQMGPSDQLSEDPVRRFLVDVEDVTVFALVHEELAYPEVTGSTSTRSEGAEMTLEGYEGP
jgi:hypothetical protein